MSPFAPQKNRNFRRAKGDYLQVIDHPLLTPSRLFDHRLLGNATTLCANIRETTLKFFRVEGMEHTGCLKHVFLSVKPNAENTFVLFFGSASAMPKQIDCGIRHWLLPLADATGQQTAPKRQSSDRKTH